MFIADRRSRRIVATGRFILCLQAGSIMSGEKSELEQQQSDLDEVCACCGITAVDDVKLKITIYL